MKKIIFKIQTILWTILVVTNILLYNYELIDRNNIIFIEFILLFISLIYFIKQEKINSNIKSFKFLISSILTWNLFTIVFMILCLLLLYNQTCSGGGFIQICGLEYLSFAIIMSIFSIILIFVWLIYFKIITKTK